MSLPQWLVGSAGGPGINEDDVDVIAVNSEAARTRNAEELAATIKAAKGKVVVDAQSSQLLVALNNRIRFAVTRNAAGQYEITDRLSNPSSLLLLAVPVVLLLVLVTKK